MNKYKVLKSILTFNMRAPATPINRDTDFKKVHTIFSKIIKKEPRNEKVGETLLLLAKAELIKIEFKESEPLCSALELTAKGAEYLDKKNERLSTALINFIFTAAGILLGWLLSFLALRL